MNSKLKSPKFVLAAFTILVMGTLLFLYRPDVELAMYIIEQAYFYPEHDCRVQLAAKYLIFTEHPSTYNRLGSMIINGSSKESFFDHEDYTAIQAAQILGKYKNQESEEVLVDIVVHRYEELPSTSIFFAVDGLMLKGISGVKTVEDIATGELSTHVPYYRTKAIWALSKSKNPDIFDTLVELALSDPDEYIRSNALEALSPYYFKGSYNIVRQVLEQDKSEYVKITARYLLGNLNE